MRVETSGVGCVPSLSLFWLHPLPDNQFSSFSSMWRGLPGWATDTWKKALLRGVTLCISQGQKLSRSSYYKESFYPPYDFGVYGFAFLNYMTRWSCLFENITQLHLWSQVKPRFSTSSGQLESDRFLLISGAKPSRKCGILSSGNNLFFNEDGLRMLVTRDLDLSHAR